MRFEVSDIKAISEDYGELEDDFCVISSIIIKEKGSSRSFNFTANIAGNSRIYKWKEGGDQIDSKGLFISPFCDVDTIRSILEKMLVKLNPKTVNELIEGFSRFVIYEGEQPSP
jgi:hypothetical protein